MMSFLNKFKIPTVLGLCLIFFGISAGVYLVLREQTFLSQASPDIAPQNLTISNVTESQVTISWQSIEPTSSFVSFGQNNFQEQSSLDNRKLIHYITLNNLLPSSEYQYKIITGRNSSEIFKFKTAQPSPAQTEFTPIIGSVLAGEEPLTDGIVYLSIAGANTQSALIKLNGNFLIPLSQIRKEDLSDIFPLTEDTLAKLTVVSPQGSVNALFKLKPSQKILPPLILGQDIDLSGIDLSVSESTVSAQELNQYDLNNDGKINATDNAIVLQNFGKNPKEKRADLNGDNTVDQKDVLIMSENINQ